MCHRPTFCLIFGIDVAGKIAHQFGHCNVTLRPSRTCHHLYGQSRMTAPPPTSTTISHLISLGNYICMCAQKEKRKPNDIHSTPIAIMHVLVSSNQTSTTRCRTPHFNRWPRISSLWYSAYTSISSPPARWSSVTTSMHPSLVAIWRRWCGCGPVEGIR
jgi:hypothetical protein